MLAVKGVDAQTDVGEGLHSEVILNECGVRLLLIDGRALHEETVTFVLELGVDSCAIALAKLGDGTREADVQIFFVRQSPLTPQVACVATFLTGNSH